MQSQACMRCETSMFARVGGPYMQTLSFGCWQRTSQLAWWQTDRHTRPHKMTGKVYCMCVVRTCAPEHALCLCLCGGYILKMAAVTQARQAEEKRKREEEKDDKKALKMLLAVATGKVALTPQVHSTHACTHVCSHSVCIFARCMLVHCCGCMHVRGHAWEVIVKTGVTCVYICS